MLTPTKMCRTCHGNQKVLQEVKDAAGKTVVTKVPCPECHGRGIVGRGYYTK